MPQPRFITSDSQLGAPGVYVQENAPASPVRGQRNRVIGIAGQCLRGPIDKAVVCTTYKRFLDVFGGRDRNTSGGTAIGHIWKLLQGKRWGKLVIARAADPDAVKASFTMETAAGGAGTPVLRIDAANVGLWGNDVMFRVYAATNGDANYFNLAVKLYGKVKVYENITIFGTNDNTNVVVGNDDATVFRLAKLAPGRPVNHAAATDGADADGYVNLGEVVAAFTSVAGTDGVIANGDYDDAMGRLNAYRGVHACAVAGRSNTTIKNAIETLASTASQRVWYVCPDDETIEYDAAVTERASLSGGRLSYWFNHAKVIDPVTKEEIWEEPFAVVLSIISQTNPNIHPGDFDNAALTGAIREVAFELEDSQRDALTAGGVSYLLRDLDANGNEVIIPGDALTCDFAVNNRDLDGRYMKDFVLDALANRMRGDQFKGNTKANRAARKGACDAFLDSIARNDTYIARDEDTGKPQFEYTNDGTVNTLSDQQAGDQTEFCVAQLIPKNRRIKLLATIGADATISEQ